MLFILCIVGFLDKLFQFWLIFAGFKSRVQFFNVRDPIKNCTYISEVQDAGPLGPLFKVRLYLHVFRIDEKYQFRVLELNLSGLGNDILNFRYL